MVSEIDIIFEDDEWDDDFECSNCGRCAGRCYCVAEEGDYE